MNINIQQTVDKTEQNIPTNAVELLYTAAHNGGLVQLSGQIMTDAIHLNVYEYLNDKSRFPNFYITPVDLFLNFDDPLWEQYCIDTYGSNGGVTVQQIKNADTVRWNIDNESKSPYQNSIKFADLRWCSMMNTACRCNVEKMIVGKIQQISVYTPDNFSEIYKIDKIEANTLTYFHAEGEGNNYVQIDTLAIRNLGNFGTSTTKRFIIDKLYIGSTTLPPVGMNGWYLDNPEQSINHIFVPQTVIEQYRSDSNWSRFPSGFEAYDFDNDPDGIFAEVDEWWTYDGSRKK